MSTHADFAALLALCHDDPAAFWRLVLRGEPRQWQAAVCEEIRVRLAAGERHIRVLCRTAHGSGKTTLAAVLALWWTATRPGSRGLSTAPTWQAVEGVLWVEISKIYSGSLLASAGVGRLLTTELSFGVGWDLVGLSTDHAVNLEGRHSPTAAVRIVDEAKAVEAAVIESTEALLDAPETLDVWISTPSIPSGPFWSRDVKGGRDIVRAVVTIDDLIEEGIEGKREWKDARALEWGLNSPEYESRCRANYVSDGEGSLFPFAWVERAMNADFDVNLVPVAGLDPAGSVAGDETALALLAGPDDLGHMQALSVTGWHERDTQASKGKTLVLCRDAGATVLAVDVVGIGKGLADSIRQDFPGVVEFRASDRPNDPTRFQNRKAEVAWALRSLLEAGSLRLPKAGLFRGSKLKEQLLAMKYVVTPQGRIKVTDPSDSPDHFDALVVALSVAAGGRPISMSDVSFGPADFFSVADVRAGWGSPVPRRPETW